jgi:hypothetical protein
VARSPNDPGERFPGSSVVRYVWTTLSSIGISAGRFLCSAFVIFEKPTPRMSANVSKSSINDLHGIELVARQRCLSADPSQGPFDLSAALKNRCDLGRRDPGAAAVRRLRSRSSNDMACEGP